MIRILTTTVLHRISYALASTCIDDGSSRFICSATDIPAPPLVLFWRKYAPISPDIAVFRHRPDRPFDREMVRGSSTHW